MNASGASTKINPADELAERLINLRRSILQSAFSDTAFDLWSDVRDQLSESEQTLILAAWSKAMYSGHGELLDRTIASIVQDVDHWSPTDVGRSGETGP